MRTIKQVTLPAAGMCAARSIPTRASRILALAVLSIGLGVSAPPAAGGESVLRTMTSSDLRGLMPGISTDLNTGAILQHIYEGLVAWRSNGAVAPMLAERIDVSPDGLTYTFTLRDGVRFHNGAPLTSAEVVWTWQQYLGKKPWGCRANYNGTRQVEIASVTALDRLRVAFKLARPSAVFLTMLARTDCDATAIAHPDSVDSEGNWSKAIGTGPFRLAEWRKGEYIELQKFDAYSSRREPTDGLTGAKRAEVDRIRFLLIPDSNSAKIAVEAGSIDLYYEIDPKFAKDLAANKNIKMSSSPVAGVSGVYFQTNDPVLADPRVRRAIAHAVDSQAMRETLTAGYGKRCTGVIPLTSAFHGRVEEEGLAYDPGRAKALLAEAGYRGQQLAIRTNDQFSTMKDVAVLTQAMLQAVGMNVKVEVEEFATNLSHYQKGQYQMLVWQITSLEPSLTLDRVIGNKEKQPEKPWGSAKAIDLLSQIFRTSAAPELQSLYDQVHRLYLQEAPVVIWTCRYIISAARRNVEGYEPWPGQRVRLWNVSLKP